MSSWRSDDGECSKGKGRARLSEPLLDAGANDASKDSLQDAIAAERSEGDSAPSLPVAVSKEWLRCINAVGGGARRWGAAEGSMGRSAGNKRGGRTSPAVTFSDDVCARLRKRRRRGTGDGGRARDIISLCNIGLCVAR